MTERIEGRLSLEELRARLHRAAVERGKELVPLEEAERILTRKRRRLLTKQAKLVIVRAVQRGELDACIEEMGVEAAHPPDHLWSRAQAAKHCGCHVETISRWQRDGTLPLAMNYKRQCYYEIEDVEKALRKAQHRRTMDYTAVQQLTGFSEPQLYRLTRDGLFPFRNRNYDYRTSEVYAWYERWQANPEAPFDEPHKNARFHELLGEFKRQKEERERERAEMKRQREKRDAEHRRRIREWANKL